MSLDWSILYWIQTHTVCSLFDLLMSKLTLLGSGGAIWLLAAGGMLCTKKYRRQGVTLLAGAVLGIAIGEAVYHAADRAYARDLPAAADTKTVKRRKSSFFFLSGLINGNCCGILGINWRKRGRSMC